MTNRSKKRAVGKLAVCASLLVACTMGASTLVASAAAPRNYVSQYRSEASGAADALKRANDLNQKIVEEGIVLLKNENKSLPMKTGTKVSVFGKNSVDPFYGGGGSASGADGSGLGGVKYYNLYDSLANAGFTTNPELKAFYEDDNRSGKGRDGGSGTGQVATLTGETPVTSYDGALKESFKDYNDAAIVVISRAGGEGGDLKTNYTKTATGRTDINNNGDAKTGDHYLELDDNEEAMIELAKANFKNVVVVLNIATSFELDGLKNDKGINSILWLGFPGGSGINALGKVLNGEVNPSGRLVDIYAKDFKKDPTFANFATNYTSAYKTEAGQSSGVTFVEYDEGIYIGYRYYETRGFVEGGNWYDDNVVYPFGYGLSYTTFEKEVKFITDKMDKDGTIEADVTVTNTGNVAGKEVIQLYYSAPYTEGEIEKSHVNLGAFEKTDIIQPGMSQTVRISMKVRDMASYDYNDANVNGISGYELDDGEYTVYIGGNSHVWAEEGAAKKTYELEDEVYYDKDAKTGTVVENRFDYMSEYFNADSEEVFGGHSKLMSRADFEGTFPQPPTADEAVISSAEQAKATYAEANPEYDKGQPWYTDKMPTYQTTRKTNISATKLVGVDFDDPRWDKFMDQLTLEDMRDLIVKGYFITNPIEDLDVPMSITPDGPTGFVQGSGYNWVGNTCSYASPILVASTWNKDLALQMGEAVGDEGIWGGEGASSRSTGVKGGYNGWYAPGNNIHRSPFSGRNFEYYSEDPVLAGEICANVVKGAQSKGVFVMLKHFALNDQETNRGNIATWADEQTVREIYLKAFEISVKDGGATGMMSAFNRFGHAWAGMSYSLLTEVLRNEWGFDGLVVTDWVNGFMRADLMIRAGNDLWLANGNAQTLKISGAALTPTHVAAMRRAAKSVLYTVINSNAMNRLGARYSSEHYAADVFSKNLGDFNRGAEVKYDAKSAVYTGYEYVLTDAPKGITINKDTGAISGKIATDATAGSYSMTVSLKDENGYIGQSIVLDLKVNGGLSYNGATTANVTVNKFARIDVSSELKGANVTYEVSGKLPDGMALTPDGAIVGTPTATGSSKVTVTAKATGSDNLAKEVTITVNEANVLEYTGKALDKVTLGTELNVDLATATGADNIVYSATGLPAGVTLTEDGKLSGTPTVAGNYTIKVSAWAEGCAEAAVTEFTLTVEAEGQPENPEKPGEPGGCGSCGSSIDIGFGIAMGAFVLAGAVVLAVRRKSRDK